MARPRGSDWSSIHEAGIKEEDCEPYNGELLSQAPMAKETECASEPS